MRTSIRSLAALAATALAVAACGGGQRMNDAPAANTPPTLAAITDQAINQDTSSAAIGFGVDDRETAATNLSVVAASSNTDLIPASGMTLGGSGAMRTITVTPAEATVGSATLSLTVTDAAGLSATRSFVVTVNAVNVAFTPWTLDTFAAVEESDIRSLLGFTLQNDAEDRPDAFDSLLQ